MNRYLTIILILASANSSGAINKWVDSDGNVHYSDHPPSVESTSKILRSSTNADTTADPSSLTAASAPATPKTLAEKEAELRKIQKAKQEAADKTAKEQANAETSKINCSNAQQNLRTLQSGARMAEIDANGERTFIEEAQRQERITKAQQDIITYCK